MGKGAAVLPQPFVHPTLPHAHLEQKPPMEQVTGCLLSSSDVLSGTHHCPISGTELPRGPRTGPGHPM